LYDVFLEPEGIGWRYERMWRLV